jgi:hypothetical protein
MARKKPAKAATRRKPHHDEGKSVYLKNEWLMGDVELKYADNLILRYQDGAFHLMFFQQQVPPLVGTPAEMEEQLKVSGVMENACVARLVISQPKMGAMIDAMHKSYEAYIEHAKGHGVGSGPNGER